LQYQFRHLKMKNAIAIMLSLMSMPLCAIAQRPAKPAYPQNYFRNPLDIPIFLAGNFGECRPGHFHSGVDIKTLAEENKAVHAAAEGYISRIKMEKGGFGHGLYITHPNGYTTLYAHLNKFAPAIQNYVEHEQYERKRWDVDLQLSPSQFPVTKGQQIAWSGNTGASTAPHLHFEIRNSKTEHPLNPELFGLPLVDKTAPVPVEVVLYSGNVYEGSSLSLTLARRGDTYRIAKSDDKEFPVSKDTAQAPAAITGIGVNVDDFMEGSDNTITFYTAQLYMDDSLQAMITLDDIGYDVSRYVNAYADYRTKKIKHKWVQCLFQLPGNRLNGIFSNLNSNKGRLDLTDGNVHKIRIVLTDDKDNESTIELFVNPRQVDLSRPQTECTPYFAGKANSYSDPSIAFTIDERQLYDDICFTFKVTPDAKAYSDRFALHDAAIPLHHYFDLEIKPNRPIPFDLRSKVVIMYSDGKDEDGRAAASLDKGWYKAGVRSFGTYWLDLDTIPPVIRSLQKDGANLAKASQLAFDVKDAVTSVRSFSGYLDGKWLCFEQHGSSFFYKFDQHCPKGKHELLFRAEDENGNNTSTKLTFTR
jgi:hypothetical protein